MTTIGNTLQNPLFISPYIRTLAFHENILHEELIAIKGSGLNGRITKEDVIEYLENRSKSSSANKNNPEIPDTSVIEDTQPVSDENGEYIPLSRLRKLIASKMVASAHTSPHVTSFVEVNVSRMVNWRAKVKNEFMSKYGVNLTFTPIFIEAVINGLKKYPTINASLIGDYLYVKKNINIGLATALPDGNLIVPVINSADNLDLSGLAKSISDLAVRARTSSLKPNEIQGSSFTITNVGSFGNIGGTPIINQPELAILAIGSIVKKPVAVQTENGYGVAVQDVVELWLSYDHRVIDGALGGTFLKYIADYLNDFDDTRSI